MSPAFSGSALYASWTWGTAAGGTIALEGDFRVLNYTPSVDLIDQTAGADGNKTYLSSVKDGQADWSSLMQTGATTLIGALTEGQTGTLTIGVEGTATGKPKMVLPSISQGASYKIVYNDAIEFAASWQQNGTRTDGTFA
jgi:hypothetical protein